MYRSSIYTHDDSSGQGTLSSSALELNFYGQVCLNDVLRCPGMQNASSGRTLSLESGDFFKPDPCCFYIACKMRNSIHRSL